MAIRFKVTENSGAAQGLALSSAGVTILTGGTGLKMPDDASGYGGSLDGVGIHNSNTTNARAVTVRLVPSGATPGPEHNIFGPESVAPNATFWIPGGRRRYKDSATVVAYQDAGTDVYAGAEASENY